MKPRHRPDPARWYTAREVTSFLGVTELTVTAQCRSKRLTGRKIGPKKRWHVLGREIQRKMKEWGLLD